MPIGKVAICTVVYNNYEILDDFFSTLAPQIGASKVYVADLSSQKQEYHYPEYATVLQADNNGYAHGINTGISRAVQEGFEQFIVVNSDVLFAKDFIMHATTSLETNPGSLIGGKIYYAPGYEFHHDRYTEEEKGKVLWFAGGEIDWNHVITHHRGVDEVDTGQYDSKEAVDCITGCLMLYDKSVHERVGTWDERYFLYYEDADYCVRAGRKGIPILYDPAIRIWHKNAQSTDGSGSSIHTRYQTRNRLRFGLAYAPFRTKLHLVKNALLAGFSEQQTQ